MILQTESEEAIRLLLQRLVLTNKSIGENTEK